MQRSTAPQLAGTTAGDLDGHRFKVVVSYTKPNGTVVTYTGAWQARSAARAGELGAAFVSKYLRPASITDTVATII